MGVEGLPWPALTAAGGGWFLFGLAMYGLITGKWFVTRREADLDRKRADTYEKALAELTEQNGLLLKSSIPTVNAVLGALHQAAGTDWERS